MHGSEMLPVPCCEQGRLLVLVKGAGNLDAPGL